MASATRRSLVGVGLVVALASLQHGAHAQTDLQQVFLNTTFQLNEPDVSLWTCEYQEDGGPTENVTCATVAGSLDTGWVYGNEGGVGQIPIDICRPWFGICNRNVPGRAPLTGSAISAPFDTSDRSLVRYSINVTWFCDSPSQFTFVPYVRTNATGQPNFVRTPPITNLTSTFVNAPIFASTSIYEIEVDVSNEDSMRVGFTRTQESCAMYVTDVLVYFPLTLSPTISPTTSPTVSAPTQAPSTSLPTVAPSSSSPTISPTTSSPTTGAPTASPIEYTPPVASSDGGGGGDSGAIIAVVIVLILLIALAGVAYWKRDFLKMKLGVGSPGMYSASAYDSDGNPNSTATILMEQMRSRECDEYHDPALYSDPNELFAHVRQWCTELRRADVKLTTLLGAGEFGEVFLGNLKTKSSLVQVACKTLRKTATPAEKMDFLSEAAVMGQFSHPNVVSLVGVVIKGDTQVIVIELMENGELLGYLIKHKKELELLTLIKVGLDVSKGMAYLAGKGFVHRDLAARNILINGTNVAKVADFGLSTSLDDDSEYFRSEGGKVPIRWTAPESLQTRKYTTSSDVWSYGILLWEIMSRGERPYGQMGNLEVVTKVEAGLRMECPNKCPVEIHALMLRCWEFERRQRITFDDMVTELEACKETAEQNGYLILDGADEESNSVPTRPGFDYAVPQEAPPQRVAPRAAADLPDYGTPQDGVTLSPNETYGEDVVGSKPQLAPKPRVAAGTDYGVPQTSAPTPNKYEYAAATDQPLDYGVPQDSVPDMNAPPSKPIPAMRPRAMSGKFGFDEPEVPLAPENYAEPQDSHTSPIPANRPDFDSAA